MSTPRAFPLFRGAALCVTVFLAAAGASGQGLPPGVVGRLGASPLRHGANVSALAISANGKRVASLGWDGHLKVWDIAAGKLLYQTNGGRSNRDVIDLSADGNLLAAPGQNVTGLHDLTTHKLLRTVPGAQGRFSPDGKYLATSQYDRGGGKYQVHIIEVESGKVLRSAGPYAVMMEDFAFAPDGGMLAAVGADSVVYLWDTATAKETVRCAGHRATVESVAFSPDGKQVVSASHDGTVRLWNAAAGKEERRFGRLAEGVDERSEWASRAALSPDGRRLFVAWGAGAFATVIDVASGRTLQSLRGNTASGAPVGRVVSGPAQLMASLSGSDGVIHVTDLITGRELTPSAAPSYIAGLAVTSDARTVALSDGGTVTLWDVPSGKQRLRLAGSAGRTLAFSSDGAWIATGHLNDTAVILWDTATGREVRQLHGHINGAQRVWFTPDARSLFVQDNGGVIHRWVPGTGTEAGQHWLKRGFIATVTADGRQTLMRYFDPMTRISEARLVDVPSGKTRLVLPPDVTGQLSPDGRFLAALGTTNDRSVRLWSAATGRLVRRMDLTLNEPAADQRVSGGSFLLFTPDGRSVAAAQGTRRGRLYEVATGLERRRLAGHPTPIRTAALSPDGRVLVTAGGDGTLFVWDLFDRQRPAATPPTPAELDAHWQQLAGGDGAKAFASVCALARAPEQAVAFFQQRLKPVAPADPQRLAKLVADLDGQDFTVRQKASEQLEKLGDLAEDVLRRALDGKPALETRQRIESLLEKLDGQHLNAESVRVVRALEVLEAIATEKARQVLEAMAQGATGARLTREARASLERLAAPPAAP